MKILLVMPGRILFEHTRMDNRALMPPSPLLEVAGMTNPDHHEVKIWDELAQGRVPKKLLEWADLVGISGLTTSRLGAYLVAERAHQLGEIVIAGGMDVTGHYLEGNSDELLAHYDAIVVGRLTSRLWAGVLADAENHRLKPVYQAESLDDEPWEWVVPRYDLVDRRRYYFPAAFRSSAGCPYGCNFCTVGLVCDQVQIKPADMLKQELALLPKTRWPWVDCSDAFGAKEEHAETALPILRDARHSWIAEIATRDLMGLGKGRKPLMASMAAAGLLGTYIGVENIDSHVVGKSPRLGVTEQAIQEAHSIGLIAMCSLVLDFTGYETKESINENVEWILRNRLDLVQLSLVAALPGSELRRDALTKGLMICQNPEFFDGAWPTIKHPLLSPRERIKLLRDAYYRIYSLKEIGRRIIGHSNLNLNTLANLAVGRMSHNWWNKVGYEHWLATGGIEN